MKTLKSRFSKFSALVSNSWQHCIHESAFVTSFALAINAVLVPVIFVLVVVCGRK